MTTFRIGSNARGLVIRMISLGVPLYFSISSLAAAERAPSLLDFFHSAQQQDHQIKAARAARDAESETIGQARARLLPNLNYAGSWSEVEQSRLDEGLPKINSDYPSRAESLVLRQALYQPRAYAALRQAEFVVEGAQARYAQESQALGIRLTEAYMRAWFSQERERSVARQLRSARTRVLAARRGFEEGVGTRTDAVEAQAQADLLQAQYIQVKNSVESSMSELRLFAGRDQVIGEFGDALALGAFSPSMRVLDEATEMMLELSHIRSMAGQGKIQE